ncbi:hypothetical protein EGR_02125 [Echinococcus granulosus]|uniref:Uncharacterized protein n=1 Tax=Echinococcus granulosus TaxID=6210 RepID=W6UQQ0_ECHGR|nr:hypothetical protein EGR_02125 [Echinococcus granulosus]EUB63031.1 hypothetical protein EGR_02125 [Echinococcus granulosus]
MRAHKEAASPLPLQGGFFKALTPASLLLPSGETRNERERVGDQSSTSLEEMLQLMLGDVSRVHANFTQVLRAAIRK